MNALTFRHIFSVAIFAGAFAGLVLTAVQLIQVVPTILEAETYEQAGDVVQLAAHGTVDADEAWAPEDGLERTLLTTLANVTIGLGFALLLGAAVVFNGSKITVGRGLLWGLAGCVVFFAAPSLGLHPEIPGTEAAPLMERQIWWVATVICSAAGLALIVFSPSLVAKVAGVALMVAPHAVGAPMPEVHSSLAPEALAHQFMIATAIANSAFWLALGAATGFFYQRLSLES